MRHSRAGKPDLRVAQHWPPLVAILVVALVLSVVAVGWGQGGDALPGGKPALGLLPTPPEILKQFPHAQSLAYKGLRLKGSVDLSAQMPPVGSQGGMGSCACWASSYYYKAFQEGKEQGWDFGSDAQRISPAFAYNLLNGGDGDSGTSFGGNFSILKQRGACSWQSMPYVNGDCTSWPSVAAWREGMYYRAQSSAYIFSWFDNPADYIDDMKAHLDGGDVFVIAIPVYSDFYNISAWPGYVYDGPGGGATYEGGHGLCVVGYDDSKAVGGAFKFVNSWGSGWGDGGYAWMSYNFIGGHAWEAWKMTDKTGYSPQALAELHVDHPKHNQLEVTLSTPGYSDMAFNNQGGDVANIYAAIDLTDALAFLPPSASHEWTLEVADTTSGSSGQIALLEIEHGGSTYPSTDPPVSVPDPGSATAKIGQAGNQTPNVDITSPGDGSHTTNSSTTVSGTASDDDTVTLVQVRVNSGGWNDATGTTSWSAPASLEMGDNLIEAQARDNEGEWSEIDSSHMHRDPTGPKSWTFLVYLDADNNLEGAGIDDLNEMEVVGSSADVNIVVQMDRIPGYDSSNGNWTGCRRYYVTQDSDPATINSTLVEDLGEVNMGDGATLRDFIQWGASNYEADRYAVVLWNHGGGWRTPPPGLLRACCWDDTDGGCLYTKEFGQAISDAGVSLAMLGFDVCMGGMIEIAYELWDTGLVSAMAGSPASEPWDGWDYTALMNALVGAPTLTGVQLADAVVTTYAAYYPAWTMTAFDLSTMSAAATAVSDFASTMMSEGDEWATAHTARGEAQSYEYSYYRDLMGFLDEMASSAGNPAVVADATAASTALGALVSSYHAGSYYEDGKGVSVEFHEDGAPFSYTPANLAWAEDTQWDEFLDAYANSPPSITGVSISPDPAYTDDDLTATPEGFDDPDGDDPVYEWQWQKDTGGGYADIAGATTDTLTHENFVKGDKVKVICTPGDGMAQGDPKTDEITILNSPPTAPTVDVTPDAPETTDDLTVTASGSTDADGEGVAYGYKWYKDGDHQAAYDDETTIPAAATELGETWRCEVTPSDGEDEGPAGADEVGIGNTPPSITGVSISPDPAYTDDDLTATPEGFDDPDGDDPVYAWQWQKDTGGGFVGIPGATTDALTHEKFAKGDKVKVICTPGDGRAQGDPKSDEITISNSPPTAPTVDVTPDAPETTDDLICNASGSTDADDDAVTYSFRWYKDGNHQAAYDDETTIPAAATALGETWRCEVTPSDGEDEGPAGADEVTVGNMPPSITGVSISPDPAYTDDDLTATPEGFDDPDGDDPVYFWQWQKDTGGGFADIPGATTDTLTHEKFAKGDKVKVICTPGDGRAQGDPKSDEITILNSPPTVPTVDVTPDAPETTDDLICNASGSTDADDDAVTYSCKWYKDGDHQAAYDDETTVPASATAVGETWQCVVTPSDGESNGPSAQDEVTVQNTPPSVGSVEISPDPAYTDDDLTGTPTGWDDPDGDPEDFTWQWSKQSGSVWQNIGGATSNTLHHGEFSKGERVRVMCTPQDGRDVGVEARPEVRAPGNPVSDEITIGNSPPTAPTVNVTPDAATAADALSCDASGSSDADGDPVIYHYKWHKNGAHQAAHDDQTSVPASATTAGETWRCQVTPTDGEADGPAGDDEVTVLTVHEVTITEGPDGTPDPVASGGQVACNAAAQDSRDGHTVTYQWSAQDATGDAAGSFDDATAQTPTWTAPENRSDEVAEYTITVTATCSEDAEVSATASYSQGVSPVGHEVTITDGPAGDANPVASGGQVACSVSAEDSRDGHTVTYQWSAQDAAGEPAGNFDDATAQTPTWTALENSSDTVAQYTISVTVSCAEDGAVSASGSYTQGVSPVPHKVTITDGPAGDGQPVAAGDEVECSVSAEDSRDGHALAYQWTAQDGDGEPAGSFDEPTAQRPIWTAPDVDVPTDFTISVTVTCEEDGTTSAEGSFTQQVLPVVENTFAGGMLTVSVPIEPALSGSMEALLGAEAVARWDAQQQGYVTVTSPSEICALGEGCWARFGGEQQVIVAGMPHAGDLFQRPMQAQWNLVGLPWEQSLPIGALSSEPADMIAQHAWAYYDGDYHLVAPINGLSGIATELEPWRGYWVLASGECDLMLDRTATAARVNTLSVGDPASAGRQDVWAIRIVARAGGTADSANYCGVSPQGDALDILNPPAAPGSVDLYFVDDRGTRRALDFRAGQPEGPSEWRLEVAGAAKGQEVTVACPDLSSVPNGLKLYLVDEDADRTVYLRTTSGYRYAASSAAPRHFRLRVVRDTGRAIAVSGLAAQEMSAGRVQIRFALSASAAVSAQVLNIAGRPVRTLVSDRPMAAGARTLTWDGRSSMGVAVPAGMYLVQVRALRDDGAQAQALGMARISR